MDFDFSMTLSLMGHKFIGLSTSMSIEAAPIEFCSNIRFIIMLFLDVLCFCALKGRNKCKAYNHISMMRDSITNVTKDKQQ